MRPQGLTCKDEEELLGARVCVGGGLVPPLKDLDAEGEGHLVCERVHDEREAVGLIRQPEARHLAQTPLQSCACERRRRWHEHANIMQSSAGRSRLAASTPPVCRWCSLRAWCCSCTFAVGACLEGQGLQRCTFRCSSSPLLEGAGQHAR